MCIRNDASLHKLSGYYSKKMLYVLFWMSYAMFVEAVFHDSLLNHIFGRGGVIFFVPVPT